MTSCNTASGVVVVVDVLRAFTTAAFAFDRGAKEIYLVSTVEEAFELREQDPRFLLAGEVNGYPIEGFDLPNSPSAMLNLDLTGQRLAMRTTAGTQGVVLSTGATQLYVASLCVAAATVESIKKHNPDGVTFIDTGVKPKGGGEEDIACSDYITSLLNGKPENTSGVKSRVRDSRAAAKFSQSNDAAFPNSDLELALEIDRFKFAMQVARIGSHLILRAQ